MNYDAIAPYYDWLGALYTGGGIRRAKHRHLRLIEPNVRVLYVGAGTGEECLEAARRGADVTVVDLSFPMLERCRARFVRASQTTPSRLSAQFVLADALRLEDTGQYDLVVAPFFLNVMSSEQLPFALTHLSTLLRDTGRLVSVDFSAPSKSSRVFSVVQRLYYWPPLIMFHFLTNNPWHGLYDYDQVIRQRHLPLALTERIPDQAYGLPLLETLVWAKH